MNTILKIWEFLEKKGLVQFGKFGLVGAIGVIFEMSAVKILENMQYSKDFIVNINPLIFGISLIINYILSRIFVFETGRHSAKKEFLLFCIVGIIALIINQGIFYLFVNYVELPKSLNLIVLTLSKLQIAKLIAIIITVSWTFVAKKFFVFKG
jgi:putative flippase GtrA